MSIYDGMVERADDAARAYIETEIVERDQKIAAQTALLRELQEADRVSKAEISRLEVLLAQAPAGGVKPPLVVPSGWVLLSDVDLTRDTGWTLEEQTQSNDWSYNLRRNVLFQPDGMHVLAKRETAGGRPYTSGDALGRHLVLPNYFRAEFTARLPIEYGMWPGLWFRPARGGNEDGEIDAVETWTYDWGRVGQRAVMTIHSEYGSTHQQENAVVPYEKLANPDPAAFHTYVVEKTRDRIAGWVDGVRFWEWTYENANSRLKTWFRRIFEDQNKRWYPRVTTQVGEIAGGKVRPETEPKPEWRQSEIHLSALRLFKQAT